MAKLLEFNLHREGFDLMLCWDGSTVVDRVRDWKPDLAIFDFNLPGKTGIELSHHFRQDDALRDVPIIIITGQGKELAREDLLAAGVNEIFTKPYSPTVLVETIRKLLNPG